MYNNCTMTNLLVREVNSKSKPKVTTNASALVEALVELGVDSIFGYPGASILSVYNELSLRENIKHFLVRHEQAAVHAAEGYARIKSKPGIVVVTSGPGFTNTITGIANAYADSTPLVVLAGDVPSNNNKGKVFQKVDIISLTKSCSKKNYLVTSKDDIKQVIKEAYEVANSGEKGPVVVALPRNILESKYIQKVAKDLHKKKTPPISRRNLYLPIIHLFGILENLFKFLDEGNKVAKVECSVVKYKVDGHNLTDCDNVVSVFILLNNRLFVC